MNDNRLYIMKDFTYSLLHEELALIEAYAKSQSCVGKDEEWEVSL